jgi:cellulose synthase/poly-beta-1,6-N-acetylglucosamine synthase-like glycosyltransferase
MKIKVSVIVPVKQINDYILKEIIPALQKQSYNNIELILVPDKKEKIADLPDFASIIPSWPKLGPADKRDIGANQAKGQILAFIDDDAYPDKNWLKEALKRFKDKAIAGVCGPGLTPKEDNLKQRVSGWVWQTWLGAGGAGTYRNRKEPIREVDDYPTFNLLVRKKDYDQVGGFDSSFWPGEDTKLCHDLVYKLGKKIIYDPEVVVYHHRRAVFGPHLKQIQRYGIQRGFFVKKLPKTSLRLGYFIPSLFFIGLVFGPSIIFCLELFSLCFLSIPLLFFYLGSVSIYLILLLISSISCYFQEKNLKLALLLMPAILTTHLTYGRSFLKGFFGKGLER